jgi:hypothetical protein
MRKSNKPKEPLASWEVSEETLARQSLPKKDNTPWFQMNQNQRNQLIAQFEQAILDTYGHFPKPLYMR